MDINLGHKGDRELFQAGIKLLAIMISFVQALLCLVSGFYGSMEVLGWFNSILIVTQLVMATLIVILLDELLQKGYGLGNGVSLFTATNIFGQVVWEALSFSTIYAPDGSAEWEGAIIFTFASLFKLRNFADIFVRSYGPNLLNLIQTVLIGFAINYYQVSL